VSQLRDRFNNRAAGPADVQNVLSQAAFINSFMMRNRLSVRATNDWTTLRADLDALARAYNVTWDWSRTQTGSTYGKPGYGYPTTTGQPYRISDRQVDALLRR